MPTIELTEEETKLILEKRKNDEVRELQIKEDNTPIQVAELKEDLYIYENDYFHRKADELLSEYERDEYIDSVRQNFRLLCKKGTPVYLYKDSNRYYKKYTWKLAADGHFICDDDYTKNKFIENIRNCEGNNGTNAV